MTKNDTILAKNASKNSKDLSIVDVFKFRKVYESKFGVIT